MSLPLWMCLLYNFWAKAKLLILFYFSNSGVCAELHELYERMLVSGETALPSADSANVRTPESEKVPQTPLIDSLPKDPKEEEPKHEGREEETKEDEPEDERRAIEPESQPDAQEVAHVQASLDPDGGEFVCCSLLWLLMKQS